MARYRMTFWVMVALLCGGSRANAFSLLGPSPAVGVPNAPANWQNPGFNIGIGQFNSDIGGPMNLGEEYRWNVPIITYAFDKSFVDYFGADGITAVERAIQVFNDLPPVSQFSSNLVEFPLNTRRVNFRAQALGLFDLKSSTMFFIAEHLGLAEPERYSWTIRDRRIITINNTPTTNYFVVQRNFDPVSLVPTPFVNGILYSYRVAEYNNPTYAEAEEIPVADPSTETFTAVAGFNTTVGTFYTGITRDDAGGMRYLLQTNNVNVENPLAGVQVAVTNVDTTLLLTNYDLLTLHLRTVDTTNALGSLLAQYPGINVTDVRSNTVPVAITNISTFFTNFPALTIPTLLSTFRTGIVAVAAYATNIISTNIVTFNYDYDNVVTNTNSLFSDNQFIHRFVQVSLSPGFIPGIGSLVTNVSIFAQGVSNFPNGLFFIRPTNFLDFRIVAPAFQTVQTNTNTITRTFGNLFAFTNQSTMLPLQTIDLTDFASLIHGTTLTPVQVTNIFTNLLITRTNQRITNVLVTNYLVLGSNTVGVITNALTNVFDYSVGNVVTSLYNTVTTLRRQTVDILPNPFVGPSTNLFITNLVSSSIISSNMEVGQVYIVPTNLVGYEFVASLFTNVSESTNFFFTNLNSANPANFTNTSTVSNVITVDLALFSEVATTNAPGQLLGAFAAAFPNQPVPLVTSTNSFFTVQVTGVVTNYLTNFPWQPAGTAPVPVVVTNFTTNVVQFWRYTFGNILTNPFPAATNGVLGVQTVTITQSPHIPAVSTNFITNVSTALITSNYPNGYIYLVPTNLLNFSIINTQLITVTNATNLISAVVVSNNSVAFTNTISLVRFVTNYFLSAYPVEFINPTNVGFLGPGRREEVVRSVSNTVYAVWPVELQAVPPDLGGGVGTNEQIITFATNVVFTANPISFVGGGSNAIPASRRGLDKVNFQRVGFEMMSGQTFIPVTNTFPVTVVTNNLSGSGNGTNVVQFMRRVVTTPDILFSAEDLGLSALLGGPILFRRTDTTLWDINNAIDGNSSLPGPGVIAGPVVVEFNKVGPTLLNQVPFFLDQSHPLSTFFIWGSFDGSTNDPIVFPTGTSISDIENQIAP